MFSKCSIAMSICAAASATAAFGQLSSRVVDPSVPRTRAMTEDQGGSPTRQTDAERIAMRDRELARETRSLVARHSKVTDNAQKEELAERLRLAVTEHFDIMQKIREAQLAELERRVKQLRELHDRRSAARLTIVEKRFQLLIDEANGLGWSTRRTSPGWLPVDARLPTPIDVDVEVSGPSDR